MQNGFKSSISSFISASMFVAMIFVLLGSNPANATTGEDVGIADIAEEVSAYVKKGISNTVPTISKNDDIVEQVKIQLSGKADERQIKSIVDVLNYVLPSTFNAATVEQISAIVKATIISVLKQGTDSDKKFEDIKERIDKLEAAKQPKMLVPCEDVDFLFEVVVGDTYDASMNKDKVLQVDGNSIEKIEIERNYYYKDGVKITLKGNKETINYEELAPMTIESKMQAIEKSLNITPDKGDDLVKRIGRAYTRINNKDWQNDDLRFGILAAYLPDSKVVATSVAIHGYFGYRRFTPGKWNWNNLGRRFSGFLSVGTGNASDNGDVKEPILSAGLGFDVVKGFVVSAGWSIFSFKEKPTGTDFKSKDSFTVGITLNSDLWKALFNSK